MVSQLEHLDLERQSGQICPKIPIPQRAQVENALDECQFGARLRIVGDQKDFKAPNLSPLSDLGAVQKCSRIVTFEPHVQSWSAQTSRRMLPFLRHLQVI